MPAVYRTPAAALAMLGSAVRGRTLSQPQSFYLLRVWPSVFDEAKHLSKEMEPLPERTWQDFGLSF